MGHKITITLENGSVTYAMKARKVLAARMIFAEVVRADRKGELNGSGCGYGISVDERDENAAYTILQNAGLRTGNRRKVSVTHNSQNYPLNRSEPGDRGGLK